MNLNLYLLNAIDDFRADGDNETIIRWQGSFGMDINKLSDVKYGLRKYVKKKPTLQLIIPSVALCRDTENNDDDMLWEDLIELQMPHIERKLKDIVTKYVAAGFYD